MDLLHWNTLNPRSPIQYSTILLYNTASVPSDKHFRLKCDRSQPCQNCIKRDLSSSCTFLHSGLQHKSTIGISKQRSKSDDIHGRISSLEELVVSLLHKATGGTEAEPKPLLIVATDDSSGASSSRTLEDELETGSSSLGRISIDNGHPNYVGAAHWEAIIDGVSGHRVTLLMSCNQS